MLSTSPACRSGIYQSNAPRKARAPREASTPILVSPWFSGLKAQRIVNENKKRPLRLMGIVNPREGTDR